MDLSRALKPLGRSFDSFVLKARDYIAKREGQRTRGSMSHLSLTLLPCRVVGLVCWYNIRYVTQINALMINFSKKGNLTSRTKCEFEINFHEQHIQTVMNNISFWQKVLSLKQA